MKTTIETTTAKNLSTEIQSLIDAGRYEKAANFAAKELGLKIKVLSVGYRKHFAEDKEPRYVFKMRLQRGQKSYTFDFGQSIYNGQQEPTMYDVLACMTKYDPESFESFCSNFGYDTDSKRAERTYKAVCKEFAAMERMFSSDELETLSYIS